MEINNSELRVGHFTSSQIYKLCKSLKSGKPTQSFYTYVKEVGLERLMGRSSKSVVKTQSMKWGKLMEVVLFNLLGMEYTMEHKSTRKHPLYGKFWTGTPDLIVPKVKTGEIKCFEPLHFAQLSVALLTEDTEVIKNDEPEAYWQSISNSLICGLDKAEIIAYMPYRTELEEILKLVEETNFLEKNGLDPTDYYFLTRENIESLPHLPDNSKMSNVNTFEFEIPSADEIFLTNRVMEANNLFKSVIMYSQTELTAMHVKYEVLMLIQNENPLFFLVDSKVVGQVQELELFVFNEEEGQYFNQLYITEKGKKLINKWRSINN